MRNAPGESGSRSTANNWESGCDATTEPVPAYLGGRVPGDRWRDEEPSGLRITAIRRSNGGTAEVVGAARGDLPRNSGARTAFSWLCGSEYYNPIRIPVNFRFSRSRWKYIFVSHCLAGFSGNRTTKRSITIMNRICLTALA